MDELELTIPTGTSLGDTADALAALRQLYRSVGRSELGERPPEWLMNGHDDGSLVVTYVPENDVAEAGRVMRRLFSEISALREGVRPESFTDVWGPAIRKLIPFDIKLGGKVAEFDAAALSGALEISRVETHFGTVEGILMRSSLLGDRDDFDIVDRLTGTKIKCIFNRDLIELIGASFGRRVLVHGPINERADQILFVEVEEIEILPTAGKSVRWGDVLGVLAE